MSRAGAMETALGGLVVAALPIFVSMPWWAIPLVVLGGVLMLAFAAHLRWAEPESAADSARLESEGIAVRARIAEAEDLPDVGVLHRIALDVRADGLNPFEATHVCSNAVCQDAVARHRRGQPASLPVLVSPAAGEWMVSHRRV
ncbi:hypothetical protein [Aeromicrobium ginsengisoli]|uniref:Uncharacterized protein n=1 Tax=Aeromicrobium ginsengisoli TaxID=363867 RepID=A0A5M4FE68_9ACTN|nr:hypothetical protein [Aeromicrobium ginsengisoli]KAA1397552.1 hypothetical protein ESP70_009275 [Aeromicrobium ginsengisoli]